MQCCWPQPANFRICLTFGFACLAVKCKPDGRGILFQAVTARFQQAFQYAPGGIIVGRQIQLSQVTQAAVQCLELLDHLPLLLTQAQPLIAW